MTMATKKMDGARKKETIAAGRFKATCLALLDRVAATGNQVIITKRGKPVAVLSPVRSRPAKSLAGSVIAQGDLISPLDLGWNAVR
jgi:prevent-host-death family protein